MAYTFDPITGSVSQSGGGGGGLSSVGGAMTSSIIPDTNDTYDIGSAEFKIRDMYVSDTTIYTDSGTLSVGTAGVPGSGDTIVNGSEIKAIAAESTDFEDFKARIAAATF